MLNFAPLPGLMVTRHSFIVLFLLFASLPGLTTRGEDLLLRPLSVVSLSQGLAMAPARTIEMNVVVAGKKSHYTVVPSSSSPASLIYAFALDAFGTCDSMLRMIVDDHRLSQAGGKSYVEISFRPAAQLKVSYGGGKLMPVSKLLVPLSAGHTTPEWTMYYLADSGDWFAMRSTKPDAKLLKTLRQSSRKLLGLDIQ